MIYQNTFWPFQKKINIFRDVGNDIRAKRVHIICRRWVDRKKKNDKGSGNLKAMSMIQRQYIVFFFLFEDGICCSFIRSVVFLLDKRMLCFELCPHILLSTYICPVADKRCRLWQGKGDFLSDYQMTYKKNQLAFLYSSLH